MRRRPGRRQADARPRWPSRRRAPDAEEPDLEDQLHAGPSGDLLAELLAELPAIGGRALRVVDDEVRVLLRDDRPADPKALEPEAFDDLAGRRTLGRVSEHAACRRQPER